MRKRLSGGSQNCIVRNAQQAGLLEFLADTPAQIRVRFSGLAGRTFGVKLFDGAARALKCRLAFASDLLSATTAVAGRAFGFFNPRL